MRKLFLSLSVCAIAITLVLSTGSTTAGASTNDQATIRQLTLEWLKAYDTRDAAALDRIEDNDLVIAGDFGEIHKKTQLESIRKQTGTPTAVNRVIENQQVRLYGDVALVTEADRYPDADHSFESTSVWVRRARSWKAVHLHFTQLAKH